ncbi:endopeptidase La [Mycoplasma phocimorsus]|uniref:endopeptidase La n=1 Tax=Mycoplasma phocimorsus TaxID=3045839 RepID=UPI0024BF9E5C|nr:endopeptidase La [Mycoplasma phocimorsus]MDJ1647848.1 endopeptidase La [Mycoplasma phocimorsus]
MKNSQLIKYIERFKEWQNNNDEFLESSKLHKYYAIYTEKALFGPEEKIKITNLNDIEKIIESSSNGERIFFLYADKKLKNSAKNSKAILARLLSVNNVKTDSLEITYEALSIARITSVTFNEENNEIQAIRGRVIMPDEILEDDKDDELYDDKFREFIAKVKDISKRAADLSAKGYIEASDVMTLTTFIMLIMSEVDNDHNIIINNYILFTFISWLTRFAYKKDVTSVSYIEYLKTELKKLIFEEKWSFMVFFYYLSNSFDLLNSYFREFEDQNKKDKELGSDSNAIMKDIDRKIDAKLKSDLDKQQTDFILREKIRVIKSLLNDNSQKKEEDEIKEKAKFPKKVLEIIQEQKQKLEEMMPSSPNADITKTYIEILTNLPWKKVSTFNTSIEKAKEVLESNHYGLEEVKKRIIEYIAIEIRKNKVRNSKDNIKLNNEEEINSHLFEDKIQKKVLSSPILTLVGPPGTGKTSLAKSIADALGRKMVKISLGGVHDEAEIRGHRRTYVGAMPGKIINAIKKSGVSNPLILLDEIDKMSSDRRGDPTSAMLEVLDPEQNAKFQDNYVEIEYDLSDVMFVATANYFENIPPALIDRVEMIELHTYTVEEKIKIARQYLISRVLEQNFVSKNIVEISDEMLKYIIKHYTMEAGVRSLYRQLDKIVRKICVEEMENDFEDKIFLNEELITKYLGVKKIDEDELEEELHVGTVNGLAFTSYGGSTLQIEVTSYPGKGELKLTGQLKEVMQESAQIAFTYVKANAQKFNINFDFDNNNIHIHVPEGATPKDGPSAGVTFTSAIISCLLDKALPSNVGMTGEITLTGKVLAIGGLKEKSLAAYHKGISQVFIPFSNKKDLIDIPQEVKEKITYIPVKDYQEIFEHLFVKKSN